jgi:aryl-alcohol dehydrogenase-like predicted oxidoreductase/4-amino-4-deoxy-L-arabinose transferase-like glycosyltransferase
VISHAASSWSHLRRRGAVLTATGVGAVTCLTGLGHQPLSWDEAVTASAAQHDRSQLVALLSHTDAPLGFYYVLTHGWVRLLSAVGVFPSEGWLRLPSALAAIMTVALVARLATDWYGPQTGLLAGVLLAVHPLFVFYAHDARPYALATMLVVAATMLFVRARRRPGPAWLVAYAVVAVLAVYAHLFAALALLVHALIVAARGPRRGRWLIAGLAVALAAGPLVWLAARQTGEIGWIPQPSPRAVASVLIKVVGGGAVALALGGVAVAAAMASRGRRWRVVPGERGALLLGWAVLPPLLLVAADFVTPVLVARYALVAVPAIAVAVAVACIRAVATDHVRARNRFVVGFSLLALLAAAGTSVAQQAQPYKYENYRAAEDLVDATAHSGDAMLFLPASTRVGYLRYVEHVAGDPHVVDVALRRGGAPGTADRIGGYEVTPAVLADRLRSHRRVFLIGAPLSAARTGHSGTEQAKRLALRSGYAFEWARGFGDVSVSLFVGPPPGRRHDESPGQVRAVGLSNHDNRRLADIDVTSPAPVASDCHGRLGTFRYAPQMIGRAPFGATGHESSRAIFGAAALGRVSKADADRALELLLEHGINHIDVAASYGDAELRIASWLRRNPGTFFVATKTGERTYSGARAEIRRSLDRLGVDRVDSIQLHNLVDVIEWETALGAGGALEAAIEAREEGLVRFIGVTGHGLSVPEMHRRSLERFAFDSVLLPYNYVQMQDQRYAERFDALAAVCSERSIALQTIKSVAWRRWDGRTATAATWYEPLREQADIDRAAHWVLGRSEAFLLTTGDVDILPMLLDAVERFERRPSDEEMAELAARRDVTALFV